VLFVLKRRGGVCVGGGGILAEKCKHFKLG
jgi:hypothetical protein